MSAQMIFCPVCRKKVSIEAQTCPHCGKPIDERHKEKELREIRTGKIGYLVLAIAIVTAIIITAILSENSKTKEVQQTNTQAQPQTETNPQATNTDPQKQVQTSDAKPLIVKYMHELLDYEKQSSSDFIRATTLMQSAGHGASLGDIYGAFKKAKASSNNSFYKYSDFSIPDNVSPSVKEKLEEAKDALQYAVMVRENISDDVMEWLDTRKPSLENKIKESLQSIPAFNTKAILAMMGAMSAAGFTPEEIQAELGAMSGDAGKSNNSAQGVNYRVYKTTDKPHIKLVLDVVIDLIDGSLPSNKELLSVAHQVLGNSDAAGKWVNFFLPQMDRKKGWFASVEIKDGHERVSFNPYNLPSDLQHLYKE